MTRFIAILAVFLAVAPPLAAAQTLADVAKAEEARRKAVKKPAKTYGNSDLKPDSGRTSSPHRRPATPADAVGTGRDARSGGRRHPAVARSGAAEAKRRPEGRGVLDRTG